MTNASSSFPLDVSAGEEMFSLCQRLYPLCRSITGTGVRQSLNILAEKVELEQHEIPSGRKVYDWTVPEEWNCREAFIEGPDGERVLDFSDHTLHVVSYSTAVDAVVDFETLSAHLHSLPEQPQLIPYRTSYFDKDWGFCLSEEKRRSLKPGQYRVRIDSSHTAGSLTYGEIFVPGVSDFEVLVSTHICHPSLANDNLSGIAVAAHLAQHFSELPDRPYYGLRFIFIPATIGAITWLAGNTEIQARIVAGLVLSGVGDKGGLTYKKSRRGDGLFDTLLPEIMRSEGVPHEVRDYIPYGYDERQFCSPGLNLPVGCLMRTPYGEYSEYHTSGDNLDLISPEQLAGTAEVVGQALSTAQLYRRYNNLQPNCEPQLGRRGLYSAIGGDNDQKTAQLALLWLLAYSDGKHTTAEIERKSGISIGNLCVAADRLMNAGLLSPMRLNHEP